MEALAHLLLPDPLLRNAMVAGVVIGAVCPVVGGFFVLRRMIFLGVALPQVAAAGIASAFLLHSIGFHALPHEGRERWMALAGSVLFTLVTIFWLALLERRGRGTTDARIGVAYAFGATASILFVAANALGESHVLSLLKGDIVVVSDGDLALMLVTYGVLLAAVIACQREMLLVSFDPDMTTTLGRRTRLWDIVTFAVVGLAIALGVMTVGPLVIFGFLVLPPLAALQVARGLPRFYTIACGVGVLAAVAGFQVSYRADLPLGPTDVAVLCAALGALTLGRRVARAVRGGR